MHHLSLYFDIFSLRPLRRYCKLISGANTDIRGQIRIFALTSSYYWTCKDEHIATKYVMMIIKSLFSSPMNEFENNIDTFTEIRHL